MKPETNTAERQLITQFLDSLRDLPDVNAELDQWEFVGFANDRRHDARIDLRIADKSFVLLIEAKKAVYPRDVRQVLWQFKEDSHNRSKGIGGDDVFSILVAESISPGAKEKLRDERVGYFDSGGSLYLPTPGAFFYIDKPPPKTLAKSMRSLFSGRRAQVLQTLLLHHQSWFGGKDLAEQALVSPATASQVLTELERFDWLKSRGQGPSKERLLSEPAALLDAWVKQLPSIRPPALRRYYIPSIRVDTLLEHIGQVFDKNEVAYAISHEAAAQRLSPFLSSISQVRCRVLMSPSADLAINELGARAVNDGANLAIIEVKSPGELLFRELVGGIWFSNPIQIYFDLLRGEGRAKEMAEHIRKDLIGF